MRIPAVLSVILLMSLSGCALFGGSPRSSEKIDKALTQGVGPTDPLVDSGAARPEFQQEAPGAQNP